MRDPNGVLSLGWFVSRGPVNHDVTTGYSTWTMRILASRKTSRAPNDTRPLVGEIGDWMSSFWNDDEIICSWINHDSPISFKVARRTVHFKLTEKSDWRFGNVVAAMVQEQRSSLRKWGHVRANWAIDFQGSKFVVNHR